MKRLKAFAVLAAILLFVPQPTFGDEYDDSQSHPLRIFTYLVHPIGVALEWVVARPVHFVASYNRETEYIFGHRPHPPIFDEPLESYDFGVTKRRYATGAPKTPRIARPEPVSERVTVKEVPVEKTVVKEVSKVIEVERVVFPDVAFRFDSSQLTDLGKGKVYLAAQKLKENSEILVIVEGHADSLGTDSYNDRLGLRRAETVKRELLRLGIAPERISVTSLGESRPLIEQQTEWARAVNRRVEFSVKAP
ncbi:MAG: OmpA family protein [Deltaproteobacteria bacterium]|nr:OmpA family protein [Deltaproteobacteria bacterium]